MRFSEHISDILKGGAGSGQKGHHTEKEKNSAMERYKDVHEYVAGILYKYEYMSTLEGKPLERFRKQVSGLIDDSLKVYKFNYGNKKWSGKPTPDMIAHSKLIKDLGTVKTGLESAFGDNDIRIAIDRAINLAHTRGPYGILLGGNPSGRKGEKDRIKAHLDYIANQTVHKNVS